MSCHGFECHLRATRFAVGTVAGDVGRGDEGCFQEFAVDVGLFLPRVNNRLTDEPFAQGGFDSNSVHTFATGSVEKEGTFAKTAEESFVG